SRPQCPRSPRVHLDGALQRASVIQMRWLVFVIVLCGCASEPVDGSAVDGRKICEYHSGFCEWSCEDGVVRGTFHYDPCNPTLCSPNTAPFSCPTGTCGRTRVTDFDAGPQSACGPGVDAGGD